jgi:hypothetical protein
MFLSPYPAFRSSWSNPFPLSFIKITIFCLDIIFTSTLVA